MHKDLEGTVCSITTLNAREKDSQGPWKIAVAYRTNSEKTFATKLLEFEVTMDFLNGRLQKLPQLCFVYFFVFYTWWNISRFLLNRPTRTVLTWNVMGREKTREVIPSFSSLVSVLYYSGQAKYVWNIRVRCVCDRSPLPPQKKTTRDICEHLK